MNPTCVCMENNRCSKEFPKAYCSQTTLNAKGYPAYKRRSPEEGGNFFVRRAGDREEVITNQWVVPYSPFLSRVFQCHINVEKVNSIECIKYLCK